MTPTRAQARAVEVAIRAAGVCTRPDCTCGTSRLAAMVRNALQAQAVTR